MRLESGTTPALAIALARQSAIVDASGLSADARSLGDAAGDGPPVEMAPRRAVD